MSSRAPNPHGHPVAAAAVVGSFAFALALVMRAAGLLGGVEVNLAQGYAARGFGEHWEAAQPWWDLLMVAALVYAVVWLLFETPGTGRRVLLLLTAVILVLAMSPVLALWGTFWSPLSAVLGMIWGGFCAILWARQHPMPCERPEEEEPESPQAGKIIPIKSEPAEEIGEVADSEKIKPAAAKIDGDSVGRKRGRGKIRRPRKK